MSRIDVWDQQVKQEVETLHVGAARDFHDKYLVGAPLGSGGFGTVKVVTEKETGKEFACKSICKTLEEKGIGGIKQKRHIDNVRREVAVLRRLRGTLNVAQFKQVYEDETDIHIVMEFCRGGELWTRIGNKHYTERTVASFMRAVFRTLSQCHSHRILHRDVKPGNFMLLNDENRAPLKAIDFGLAVFFDPADLPRTDLGLEGTPWFMAPEVMSSQVYPTSDIWAAGVMTYQLLSGQMPFDDRRKPSSPALSAIWKAILTQEPSFNGKAWDSISEPAKAFVKRLLNKDPKARPSAKEALQDPWLKGNSLERSQGKPLDATVVQRIQRYAQTNVLKRTIFELIAEELIKTMTHQLSHTPEPSAHGGLHDMDSEHSSGSMHHTPEGSPIEPPNPSWSPFMTGMRRKRSLGQNLPDTASAAINVPRKVGASAHGGLEYHRAFGSAQNGATLSVHEAGYWRMIKAAVEAAKQRRASSMHGGHHYMRATGNDREAEREQHRKSARLALDTSAHAGSEYHNFLRDSDEKDEHVAMPSAQQEHDQSKSASADKAPATSPGQFGVQQQAAMQQQAQQPAPSFQNGPSSGDQVDVGGKVADRPEPAVQPEAGKRGQSQYAQFLRRSSVEMPQGAQTDSAPLCRRSSSMEPASAVGVSPQGDPPHSPFATAAGVNSEAKEFATTVAAGNTAAVARSGAQGQKLHRKPSRVHFVAAQQSADGDSDSADHVQEAVSHREQVSGAAEAQEDRPQLQQRSLDRRLTFQEMLRQQIQAHSHQIPPEEQHSTLDPSTRLSSPTSTPPASNRHPHISFQDMLRQQLGQQVNPEPAKDPSQRPPTSPQPTRTSFQEMLQQQSYGAPSAAVDTSSSHHGSSHHGRPDVNTTELATSGGSVGLSETASSGGTSLGADPLSPSRSQVAGSASPGRSHHSRMAQVTPVGLRLYDAQGSCSIVPLEELRQMMKKLSFSRDRPGVDVEQLSQGLKGLGFELAPSELGVLMGQISLTQQGQVAKHAFLASQVDWQDFQHNFRDQWLECARAAFASMDSADKGHIKSSQLVSLLSTKLPAEEVEHAVEDALMEAGCGDMEDLDFNGFLKLLRVNSMDSLDSLDQYDSRINSSSNLMSLDANPSGHGAQDGHHPYLESVPE